MKNFDNEIKKSIEEIKPDPYMETRLSAKVSDYKKPKVSPLIKRISAAALALAIICAGVGANYAVKKNRSDLDFTIVAYASNSSCILSEKDIKMGKCRVQKEYISDTNTTMLSSTSTGFQIEGDNIDEVLFKSDNYELEIYDQDMRENQWERDDYYIVDIPLEDNEIKEFIEIDEFDIEERTEKSFIENMMKNRDLSAYFGSNSMNPYDYHVFKNYETEKELIESFNAQKQGYLTTHFYLVKNETYEPIVRSGYEITEKNYDENDKISDVKLDTWTASEYIMEHPDAQLSELPKNTITITVKFKGGQTATAKILTSFDDDGYLHCSLEQ